MGRQSVKKQSGELVKSEVVNRSLRPHGDLRTGRPNLNQSWGDDMCGVPMLNPQELHCKITYGEGHEYTVRRIGEIRISPIERRLNIVAKVLVWLAALIGNKELVAGRRR